MTARAPCRGDPDVAVPVAGGGLGVAPPPEPPLGPPVVDDPWVASALDPELVELFVGESFGGAGVGRLPTEPVEVCVGAGAGAAAKPGGS